MLIPILGWLLFGLLIGAIARALYPGRQSIGLLATMLLGIAGSFVGGFIAYWIVGGSMFQASGWIGSILGAVAIISLAYAGKGKLSSKAM